MAVTVVTSSPPTELLAAVREAIQTKKVQTWELVQEVYLTHAPPQWARHAFFRPSVQHGTLVFHIVPPQGQNVTTEAYAVYHGRLIEMLLAHFDSKITQATATAMPVTGDVVR
jgi:hypothetical protein